MTGATTLRRRALGWLTFTNVLWGLSFLLIKAVLLAHLAADPAARPALVTMMTIAPRFVLGALLLGLWLLPQWRTFTRREIEQGLWMGLSGCGGMYFQNSGLQETSASIAAFLTQFYVVLIPAWVALQARRWPSGRIWWCCALVLAGVAVLARVSPATLHIGWGETQILFSAAFFAVQIYVASSARFAGNRALPVTFVLFVTAALVFTLAASTLAPDLNALLTPWCSPGWLGATLALTLFCTLATFTLLCRWQPLLTPTEAGLIYCLEPVFAAALCLFLPAWISGWLGISYANETLTWHLWVGGALVTAANVLIQIRPSSTAN